MRGAKVSGGSLAPSSGTGRGVNADADPGNSRQGPDTPFKGGPCGDDIIHDQHMLVAKLLRIRQDESLLHVHPAIQSIPACLGRCAYHAYQAFADVLYGPDFAHTIHQELALVIAAMMFLARMQRHRQEQVYCTETRAGLQVLGHVPAQLQTQLLVVLVLDPMQHPLHHSRWIEVKECACSLQHHLATEEFFHPVPGVIVESCPGQVVQAQKAKGLLEMAKALVTATTTARQEKASEVVDGPCNEGC